MKSFSRFTVVLTVLFFVAAGAAKADTLLSFDLTGPLTPTGRTTATFELYAHPVITSGNFDAGYGFTVDPIDLKIDGIASNDFLAFYSTADFGGFGAFSDGYNFDFDLTGPQLYSGHEWAPIFKPTNGATSMEDFFDDVSGYTLTVTPAAATSEPSSLLLLGMALLLPLGLGLQRLR